jgi:hypothetical protein
MSPEVIAAKTLSSGGGLVVTLILLLLIVAAASGGGGGGVDDGLMASDRRIKTDISWVGLTSHALPIYQYRYRGSPTRFEGVMAQDVLARRPDAVVRYSTGMMAVDYGKLGLKLRVLH